MGRHKTTSLDDPINKKAIELYKNGATVEEAANAVFLSRAGLAYRLKVMGIKMRGTKATPPEVVEKIRQERRTGKPYMQISRECNVGYDTVIKYSRDIKLPTPRGRKRVIAIDDPITQKAVALYQKGVSIRKTAQALNISEGGLWYRFKVLGIPRRQSGRKEMTAEQIEQIRREYKSGKSYYRIAKEMGISPPTVRKYAK